MTQEWKFDLCVINGQMIKIICFSSQDKENKSPEGVKAHILHCTIKKSSLKGLEQKMKGKVSSILIPVLLRRRCLDVLGKEQK